MKHIWLVFSIVLLLCGLVGILLLPSGEQQSKVTNTNASAIGEQRKKETATVTVDAQKMWTNTNIQISAGDLIKIEASGEVNGSVRGIAANKWVGPDGWKRSPSVTGQAVWLLGNNSSYMCLIGRVGNGRPFKVGRQYSFTATASGPLHLGINDEAVDENSNPISDDSPGWKDNAGSFTVTVQTEPR